MRVTRKHCWWIGAKLLLGAVVWFVLLGTAIRLNSERYFLYREECLRAELLRANPDLRNSPWGRDSINFHTERSAWPWLFRTAITGYRTEFLYPFSCTIIPHVTEVHIDCYGQTLSDLSPLENLHLGILDLYGCMIEDRRPLADCHIEILFIDGCMIKDLTVFQNVQLKRLSARASDLSDLSALKGMPLRFIDIEGSKVSDLSPLEGMPLVDIRLAGSPVESLAPLRNMKLLICNLCDLPEPGDSQPSNHYPLLDRIDLSGTCVKDLSPLKHLPLKRINLRRTPISDLSSLAGFPLEYLDLRNTKVSDLTPLVNVPLKRCYIEGTPAAKLPLPKGLSEEKVIRSGAHDVNVLEVTIITKPEADVSVKRSIEAKPEITAEDLFKEDDDNAVTPTPGDPRIFEELPAMRMPVRKTREVAE